VVKVIAKKNTIKLSFLSSSCVSENRKKSREKESGKKAKKRENFTHGKKVPYQLGYMYERKSKMADYDNVQLPSNYQSIHKTSIACTRRRRLITQNDNDTAMTALKYQRPNNNLHDNHASVPRQATSIKCVNNINKSNCHTAHGVVRRKWKTFSCYKSNNSFTLALLLLIGLLLKINPCSGFVLDGSQNSYAQFRKWYTGLNGTLELEFKTEQPNGLVLYTDDGGTYDFFELKLVEGALRLRYNLGGGAQIITVGRDLHDGHWHKVQVSFLSVKY
jgi:hypothetical protein